MIRSPVRRLTAAVVAAIGGPRFNNTFSFFPMFSAGAEQGLWYDPSDFSTLFQDAAGTTPVTAVEQPVGLVLDKLGGYTYGPELVTNGDFANGTGWTAGTGWSIGGGVASAAGAVGDGLRDAAAAYTTGRTYEVAFDKTGVANVTVYIRGGVAAQTTSSGPLRLLVTAGSGGTRGVEFYLSAAGSIDNVSVREVTGRAGLVRGPEMITNGSFDANTTGWTASGSTLSAVGGKLVVTASTTAVAARAQQTLTTVVGKYYELLFTARKPSGAGGSVGCFITNGSTVPIYALNTVETERRCIFAATAATVTVNLEISATNNVAGHTAEFDNVSVRELPGYHALQATAAARPTVSARRNQLTKSEQLDDAAWSKVGCTVSPQTGTMDAVVESTGLTEVHTLTQSTVAVAAGVPVAASWRVKAVGRPRIAVDFPNSVVFGGVNPSATFDLTTGVVLGSTATTATIAPLGGGEYRVAITATTVAAGSTGARLGTNDGVSGGTYMGDGRTACLVGEAQFEWGTATRYQRVNTTTDYDTAGFPHYLKFDGVDDLLATGIWQRGENSLMVCAISFTGLSQYRGVMGHGLAGTPPALRFQTAGPGVERISVRADTVTTANITTTPAVSGYISPTVQSSVVSGGTSTSYRNGVAPASFALTGSMAGGSGSFSMGGVLDAGQMNVYGVLYASTSALTTANRQTVERQLASKSGVTL